MQNEQVSRPIERLAFIETAKIVGNTLLAAAGGVVIAGGAETENFSTRLIGGSIIGLALYTGLNNS